LSLLLILPYLLDLAGAGGRGPGPLGMFQLTVRDFSLALFVPTGTLSAAWRRILVLGPLLPMNYLLEFGLFFVVAGYKWRERRSTGEPFSRQDVALAIMAAVSIFLCTFLRSSLIGSNDLGWRGMMVAEIVLFFWAVDLFGERERLTFLTSRQKL